MPLISRLAGALSVAGVRYCHWKSNAALDRSVSGENDLDLLVAREDVHDFVQCLHRLHFKPARPAPRGETTAVAHYFGYDDAARRLVHVHAHYQLVVGDDLTKNYRIPIEASYLRSCDRSGLLPVPSPELEYLVLVMRLVLKHCPWEAQLARKGRTTASERAELAHLEALLDERVLQTHRGVLLPLISARAFARCRMALAPRAGPARRAIAGFALQHALRSHGRRSPAADTATKLGRRLRRRLRALFRNARRGKRLDTGGIVIGIVGGDGSGKSSIVTALVQVLERDLAVRPAHLGKPPRSLTTRLLRRGLRPLRAKGRLRTIELAPWERPTSFPGYAFMLWHVAIARDRMLEHRRIRRAAGDGDVVICDRYPLAALRLMDGPRADPATHAARRPIARWLAAREAEYYRQIVPPDLTVVLRVDPAVAQQRRPEQDAEFVRRRAGEVWEHDWSTSGAVVIDANQRREEVADAVLAAVWKRL